MSRSNTMSSKSSLKLGLFSPNCEGGLAITTVPERWHATWENNLALAKMADEAGLDFILPISRWKGHGGPSGFHDSSLETLTWASGLLASTSRITVVATVHVPMFHPIVAAKQMVTVDHVGRGRFGLNIVCGWNPDEFAMFGMTPLEHDERYVQGQEWLDAVRLIWHSDEPAEFHGSYYDLPAVIGRPAPYDGDPVLVNAGFSPAGRRFAERNCDFLFTTLVDTESGRADVQEIKGRARREHGREIGVLTTGWVVCRPTEAEAREFHHYYAVENPNNEAADRLMTASGLHGKAFPDHVYTEFRDRFVSGHGGYPLVGTPDQVADELQRVSETGFDGVALGFLNYLDDLPYFRDEVMPRLEARKILLPVSSEELGEAAASRGVGIGAS